MGPREREVLRLNGEKGDCVCIFFRFHFGAFFIAPVAVVAAVVAAVVVAVAAVVVVAVAAAVVTCAKTESDSNYCPWLGSKAPQPVIN